MVIASLDQAELVVTENKHQATEPLIAPGRLIYHRGPSQTMILFSDIKTSNLGLVFDQAKGFVGVLAANLAKLGSRPQLSSLAYNAPCCPQSQQSLEMQNLQRQTLIYPLHQDALPDLAELESAFSLDLNETNQTVSNSSLVKPSTVILHNSIAFVLWKTLDNTPVIWTIAPVSALEDLKTIKFSYLKARPSFKYLTQDNSQLLLLKALIPQKVLAF